MNPGAALGTAIVDETFAGGHHTAGDGGRQDEESVQAGMVMRRIVVIDDEGKAKLVEEYRAVTRTSVSFSAPMTLTAGPVQSVQLLVAVASDVPLETIATRDGILAETFFNGLAGEIRNRSRRIHYGITSFLVR